jgi:SAM-dependent methyltransferase
VGPDDRILDAGCGKGAVLAPAARVACSAVGVELSPEMAERARAAAPAAEVVVGDAGSLEFEDGSFDLVLSGFVVFFMDDPTAALREWGRVLRPGGRLAISTWADSDPRWAFEREIRRSFAPEFPPGLLKRAGEQLAVLARFEAPDKVEAELATAGFGEIEVEPHAIEFFFADEQAWLDWNMSHASRAFIDALSPDVRERYRDHVFEAMQPLRSERGFPRTYTALFARATAAAGDAGTLTRRLGRAVQQALLKITTDILLPRGTAVRVGHLAYGNCSSRFARVPGEGRRASSGK